MAGFDAFYFSFITLSTVGYGDITPVSRIARWLAAMEAMTGSLYVAVLIAGWSPFTGAAKENSISGIQLQNPMIRERRLVLTCALTQRELMTALTEAGYNKSMEFSAVDFIKTLGVSFAALFPM